MTKREDAETIVEVVSGEFVAYCLIKNTFKGFEGSPWHKQAVDVVLEYIED